MKNKIYVSTLFLFFMFPFAMFSQPMQFSAEQSVESIALLEKASRAIIENSYQPANDYIIPLTIHILHEDDGSGGAVSNNDILENFCDAAAYYAEYGITLYIDSIRHTNNSNFYSDLNTFNTMTFILDVENTINIYMLKDGINSSICATYRVPYGVIAFFGNSCFDGGSITRTLGSALGLAVTYRGFEGTGDNCGIQVTAGEKVDGSNCSTAGDRLCDTPPDYAVLLWECDANEEGCIQIDPDGVEFRPDGTNFMSSSNCRSRFSPMQAEVMKYTVDSSLQHLSVLPVPNLSEITDSPVFLSPAEGADNIFHEKVYFSWEPVENATHYLIEISRGASFSSLFRVTNAMVGTNEYTNSDLLPNVTYYWRIKPYNPGYLCAPYSDSGSFTTALETSLESVDGLQNFQVYPNPSIAGQLIGIELQSNKYLEGILSLHNVQGQAVYSNAITMNGTNRFEIKTEDLPTGLYIMNVDFSNIGTIQRKVLIVEQ